MTPEPNPADEVLRQQCPKCQLWSPAGGSCRHCDRSHKQLERLDSMKKTATVENLRLLMQEREAVGKRLRAASDSCNQRKLSGRDRERVNEEYCDVASEHDTIEILYEDAVAKLLPSVVDELSQQAGEIARLEKELADVNQRLTRNAKERDAALANGLANWDLYMDMHGKWTAATGEMDEALSLNNEMRRLHDEACDLRDKAFERAESAGRELAAMRERDVRILKRLKGYVNHPIANWVRDQLHPEQEQRT